MIEKTSCQHCEQHIEFEVEHAGTFVPCPNCGKQTRLIMPGKKLFQKGFAPKAEKSKLINCPTCDASISRKSRFCIKCGEPFKDSASGAITGLFAAAIFITGGILLLDGVSLHTENIMQQSYQQAREGFGLILMALAAMIAGIVRLVRK